LTEEAPMDVAEQTQQLAGRFEQNVARLGSRDVVVATVPGSGSSLFGTLILELGFQHLDQYFNILHEDGRIETDPDYSSFRARMSGYAALDSGEKAEPDDERARFFRCHLPPDSFDVGALHGAVLLVRDPRDAANSLYQFLGKYTARQGLADPGTFADFLGGTGFNGTPPMRAWTEIYQGWLAAVPQLRRCAIVHFADLKKRPVEAVTELLTTLELDVAPEVVERAVERSSFESMRAHEEKVVRTLSEKDAPDLRMMRRGKVDEWQEWLTPELAPYFSDPELVAVAAELGYSLEGAGQ
jgi:hypothetical protein